MNVLKCYLRWDGDAGEANRVAKALGVIIPDYAPGMITLPNTREYSVEEIAEFVSAFSAEGVAVRGSCVLDGRYEPPTVVAAYAKAWEPGSVKAASHKCGQSAGGAVIGVKELRSFGSSIAGLIDAAAFAEFRKGEAATMSGLNLDWYRHSVSPGITPGQFAEAGGGLLDIEGLADGLAEVVKASLTAHGLLISDFVGDQEEDVTLVIHVTKVWVTVLVTQISADGQIATYSARSRVRVAP